MSFSTCSFRAQTVQGLWHIFLITSQWARFCRPKPGPKPKPSHSCPLCSPSFWAISHPNCIPAMQWRNPCRKCCLWDRKLQRSQTSSREAQQHWWRTLPGLNNSLLHKVNSPSTLKAASEKENNRWKLADCRNRARREKRVGFIA